MPTASHTRRWPRRRLPALAARARARVIPLVSGAALAGCGSGAATSTAPATIAPAANAYLTAVLDTMQRNSVNRDKIDWSSFRAAAFASAGAAQRIVDTYPAIQQAVAALGDHHSYFALPGTSGPYDPPPSPVEIPSGRLLDARTAYLFVPRFIGTNPVARADSIQALIRQLDAQGGPAGPCGWVVDLRVNLGGDPWAMVAGVGPLLGDGTAGIFAQPDSVTFPWYYRAGKVGLVYKGVDQPKVTASAPYVLRRAAAGGVPAVAVLYGPQTASAAELTAISFRAMPNTRSFGTPTAGLTTGIYDYTLPDGADLGLATSVEGDRTGRFYQGPLPPDVATLSYPANPAYADADSTLKLAVQWTAAQPACAGTATARVPQIAPAWARPGR